MPITKEQGFQLVQETYGTRIANMWVEEVEKYHSSESFLNLYEQPKLDDLFEDIFVWSTSIYGAEFWNILTADAIKLKASEHQRMKKVAEYGCEIISLNYGSEVAKKWLKNTELDNYSCLRENEVRRGSPLSDFLLNGFEWGESLEGIEYWDDLWGRSW